MYLIRHFLFFSKYIHNTVKVRNDPSFVYERVNESESAHHRNRPTTRPLQVLARKTEMKTHPSYYSSPRMPDSCPVHGTNHSLNMCRSFRAKPLTERKEFLKKNGLCFYCCGPQRHLRRDCRETVKCVMCKSDKHPSDLHEDDHETRSKAMEAHGGEGMNNSVNTACTQVCGTIADTSRSCAKIVLVNVYPTDSPHCSRTLYPLIDDQSNRSLASSSFLTNLWNTLQHWNIFYPHVQESSEHQVVLLVIMFWKALVMNSASLFQNSSNVTASQTTEIKFRHHTLPDSSKISVILPIKSQNSNQTQTTNS